MRTIGHDQVVEESVARFTHSMMLDYMLPCVAPKGKPLAIAIVAIAKFDTPQPGPSADGGSGSVNSSRTVQHRWVSPAAIAGVRWRYRCAIRLPPRPIACASACRNDWWGRAKW